MPAPQYTDEDLSDHVGVGAVIKDEDGRVLMQEHVKYGFWTIPIGKVRLGASPVDGLKEEVREETGVLVEECEELGVKEYSYTRNGKLVRLEAHLYEVIAFAGAIENREPEKHRRQVFLSLDEIRALPYLSDMTLQYLELHGITRPARL